MPKYFVRLQRLVEYEIVVDAESDQKALHIAKVDVIIDHDAKGQDRYIRHDDWQEYTVTQVPE